MELSQRFEACDTDTQLMLSVKSGDMAPLEILIRKHRGPLARYVYRKVGNYAISEELAQEAFLKVHRYREGYEATAKFRTWLYHIAARLALNWLRDHAHDRCHEALEGPPKYRSKRQYPDRGIRIDEWMVWQLRLEKVRRAVHELPERQRRAVLLHKFEEIGCDEIGIMMGCSHQAVRSILNRAYVTLRKRLADLDTYPTGSEPATLPLDVIDPDQWEHRRCSELIARRNVA